MSPFNTVETTYFVPDFGQQVPEHLLLLPVEERLRQSINPHSDMFGLRHLNGGVNPPFSRQSSATLDASRAFNSSLSFQDNESSSNFVPAPVGDHLEKKKKTSSQSQCSGSMQPEPQLQPLQFNSLPAPPQGDIFSCMDYFSSSSSSTSTSEAGGSTRSSVGDRLEAFTNMSTGGASSSQAPSERADSPAALSSSTGAKVKTVLCKYYLTGQCSRGERCSFAHGQRDLRSVQYTEESSGATGSVAGDSSEGDIALVANPNRKTKLCRNLFEEGLCPFSVNCNFAHSLGELKKTPGHIKGQSTLESSNRKPKNVSLGSHIAAASPLGWSVPKAEEYAEATSFSFPSAVESNALYKTRMCKHFIKSGQCWLKKDCRFAHGKDELRKDEN